MGWTFRMHDYGKPAIVEDLAKGWNQERYDCLENRLVGNRLWQLVHDKTSGERFIALHLLAKQRGAGWGYKSMTEHSGPYYYDCPATLLARATEPTSEDAKAWRRLVKAHHARRQVAPTPQAGMVLKEGAHEYRLVSPLGARQGWLVHRVSDGQAFRMPAKQVSAAMLEMVAAQPPSARDDAANVEQDDVFTRPSPSQDFEDEASEGEDAVQRDRSDQPRG